MIRGESDAERNRILAEAYGADPEFFAFMRSMDAYRGSLKADNATMLVEPDSAFFDYLHSPEPRAAGDAARRGSRRRRRQRPAPAPSRMVDAALLGLGLVAIIEGLALAIAPAQMRDALEAIARMDPERRRLARAPRRHRRHRPCLGVAGVRILRLPRAAGVHEGVTCDPWRGAQDYPRGPAVRPPVATEERRRMASRTELVPPRRRRPLMAACALALAVGFCHPVAAQEAPQDPAAALRVDPGPRFVPESFAELSDRLSPAVVNITTTTNVAEVDDGMRPILPPGSPFEDFFRDFMDRQEGEPRRQQRSNALGSGFIISADGYIVTNNHVIESADEIEVELYHGGTLEATLVGRDTRTDIALLKVESDEPLPFVEFGDSDAAQVGDWVLAIGNPLGQGFSVSAGIVSARNRTLQGSYDDFIQTDAAINRGNSGGPLFDMQRPGDRGEHRHPLAQRRLDRHRLRHVGGGRLQRGRPAPRLRRDPPRLARRAHPERRRGRGRRHRPRGGQGRARHRRARGPGARGRA